jgi:hypothetical protein
MIDKKLIAMCDCPEIQGMWEPKVGDAIVFKYGTGDYPGNVIKPFKRRPFDQRIEGYFDKLPHQTENTNAGVMTSRLIYIPRIDDVLEWLVPYKEHVDMKDNWVHWLDIAVELALDLFMHLEHSKTWDGETWK